jgi:uncharacterized membrane protein
LDYKSFYDKHWKLVWTAVLAVPPAFIALGCILWPEVLWDDFMWRYIWGPIVADAKGEPQQGVTEGYNVVNTLFYAMVLSVAVIGIWRAFNHLGIRLDTPFLVAMVPWVLLGSILRALEDASLFSRDGVLVYLFISPVIYLLIGLVVFFLTIWAHRIGEEADRHGTDRGLVWAAYALVCLGLPPVLVHVLAPGQMAAHSPYHLLPVVSALGLAVLWWRARTTGRVSMPDQVTLYGSVLTVFSLSFVVKWVTGDGWSVDAPELHAWEMVIIPGLAVACTLVTVAMFWAVSRRWPEGRTFVTPLSVMLYASHYLDGSATFRGIDFHGYGEKHVLPGFLIDALGTAAVMLPLKFLVVTLAIYVLDVSFKEDLREAPNLGWLVKVAILVLGLAPGTRDMLRLAMGV